MNNDPTQTPPVQRLGAANDNATQVRKTVKSFVKREGRMTIGQKRAMQTLWPRYGVDPGADIRIDSLFSHPGPVILEIGFGMGEALAEMAHTHPTENYLGIEVHRPGVGRLLSLADKLQLQNLRVICADAVEVLNTRIADNSLQRVQIFFPDPWPKKRHHKRRLLQADFVSLLGRKLSPGGLLHVATDWHEYAEHIMQVLQNDARFENTASTGAFVERPDYRPQTKFEQRGQRLGHGVWDIVFRRL